MHVFMPPKVWEKWLRREKEYEEILTYAENMGLVLPNGWRYLTFNKDYARSVARDYEMASGYRVHFPIRTMITVQGEFAGYCVFAATNVYGLTRLRLAFARLRLTLNRHHIRAYLNHVWYALKGGECDY